MRLLYFAVTGLRHVGRFLSRGDALRALPLAFLFRSFGATGATDTQTILSVQTPGGDPPGPPGRPYTETHHFPTITHPRDTSEKKRKKSIDKDPLRVYTPNMPDMVSSSELMAIHQCVGMNLRRAARLVTQWYDRVLKPTGLKGTQFTLLFAIYRTGHPTFTPLARKMGMDRTTLARNLQVLRRRKLLRIEEGEDRRQQVITLTAKGQGALSKAIPYWKKAQARAVALFKGDRWKTLVKDIQTFERLIDEE